MITVMGLGFVGLTTGLGFAEKGFTTYGFDVDDERLTSLKRGKIPFHEPHLGTILGKTANQTFFLDSEFEAAVQNSEAIFLCVGTPNRSDGGADLKQIFAAIEQILAVPTAKYQVIIIKSTVPPATVSSQVIPFVNEKLKQYPQRKLGFAVNPEFLREGFCWQDFIEPDRIVVGVEDERAKDILERVYQPFGAPIHYVSYNSAEFIKYLSNTLLSTMISYANEMSIIADHIGGIDIPQAFQILHEDKRWHGSPAGMAKYVYPGCGYGGYCLPKDTAALIETSKEHGYTPGILAANRDVNIGIMQHIAATIGRQVDKAEPLGILGLSFKPDSDDVRITPTKTIIEHLLNMGFENIYAYDPIANAEFQKYYPDLKLNYCDSLDEI
jgi:UDPglucose 6-dehydrogenase